MVVQARAICLQSRPIGAPKAEHFSERLLPLSEPGPDEVLVRNRWLSLDPYMRLYLTELPGAHPTLPLGEPLTGGAVGIVEVSNAEALPPGSWVMSPMHGWRDRYVAPAKSLRQIDPDMGPLQHHLGLFGLTGITAAAGIWDVLAPEPRQTLFVSGAAGAVGCVAVQLARQAGARVLASAGSEAKGRWLVDELGADAFVNYRSENVGAAITAFAPNGLDLYFDNVGGAQLEAALDHMAVGGKAALCGAIAQYDDANYRAGPRNLFSIIERGVILHGFNAGLYTSRAPEFVERLAASLADGSLVWRETVREGFDALVPAFCEMLSGGNVGKMLVRLPETED